MTMHPRTTIIVVATVVVAGALGVVWTASQARRDTESSVVELARKNDAVIREVQSLQSRLASIESDRATLQAKLTERPKVPAAASTSGGQAPVAAGRPNPMEVIMQDPKLQNSFFAAQRATLATRYGPLFRRLGLNPAQIGQFEDIMIKREETEMDLMAAAQAQHLPPDSPELATLRKQSEDETTAAAAALLGPADYAQWQGYERTAGVRGVVQNFAGAAVLEAMPLTAQQADQLTQILAETSARYGNGGNADYNDIDWTTADRRLAGVLSEAQLKLFQQIEPLGGGPSRFGARLGIAFGQAMKADGAGSAAPGGKQPGG